jgi:Na+-translocating ferredoxin:NAD+ oxidoreductase RnfD subunit
MGPLVRSLPAGRQFFARRRWSEGRVHRSAAPASESAGIGFHRIAPIGFLSRVRTWFTGDPLAAELAPITGPMYQLFIFFMITDPKTTVSSKKGQIAVAFCTALVEAIFRLFQNVDAPFYALFYVGPIAFLIEIWWKSRPAAGAKAKAAPAV